MQALTNAYSLIERFALVYGIGTALALVAPIFLDFRPPPVLLQVVVLVFAIYLGWSAFARRHGRSPDAAEWLVALFVCVALVAAIQFFLSLKLSPERSHLLQRFFTVLAAGAFGASYALRTFMSSAAPKADTRPAAPRAKVSAPVDADVAKIPLSIGFANLATDPASELRRRNDMRVLSPLFAQALAPAPGQVPGATVLVVYARLQPDGTIADMPHPVGIRQLVQATKAGIVILATDNDPDAIRAAIALPGPKTANIVFSLGRKGELLPKFLASLFAEMARGTEMLSAWVKLCPQGPASARPDLPATLLVAEGGKLAFPVPGAEG